MARTIVDSNLTEEYGTQSRLSSLTEENTTYREGKQKWHSAVTPSNTNTLKTVRKYPNSSIYPRLYQ